jgi:hypothetical protein
VSTVPPRSGPVRIRAAAPPPPEFFAGWARVTEGSVTITAGDLVRFPDGFVALVTSPWWSSRPRGRVRHGRGWHRTAGGAHCPAGSTARGALGPKGASPCVAPGTHWT